MFRYNSSRDTIGFNGARNTTANDNKIDRAEALKRSMLSLMNSPDKPHYVHPMFWAPFVVVGEGGK
jgi:CHAT domain-containing protein